MKLSTFVLAAGASARLWRLAAVDGAGAPLRDVRDRALVRLAGPRVTESRRTRLADSLAQGWDCPFCLGFHIAAAVLATGLAWGDTTAWQYAAGTLAMSYLTGHLGARLDGD